MSLHLFGVVNEPGGSSEELRIICAYESGEVAIRRYTRIDKHTSVEGAGWEVIWNVKLHVESGALFLPSRLHTFKRTTVMAMRVSKANDMILTVSADHIIGRYDISVRIKSSISSYMVLR